jgi:ribosomal protein S12 methylthiotransferase
MRRGSSGEQFLRLAEKIRAAIPQVALRTSMIVGFPGETEGDFKAMLDFVGAAEFDHLGVFVYSNEETSAAYPLPNQVPARVAQQRRRQLLGLQGRISKRKLKQRIGHSFPLLVEGLSRETDLLFQGRLESQAPEIDGQVLVNDIAGAEPQPGDFRWVTITAASDYDLVGRLEAQFFAERVMPARGQSSSAGPRLVHIQPAAQSALA